MLKLMNTQEKERDIAALAREQLSVGHHHVGETTTGGSDH
jgi:hypothetical protein